MKAILVAFGTFLIAVQVCSDAVLAVPGPPRPPRPSRSRPAPSPGQVAVYESDDYYDDLDDKYRLYYDENEDDNNPRPGRRPYATRPKAK